MGWTSEQVEAALRGDPAQTEWVGQRHCTDLRHPFIWTAAGIWQCTQCPPPPREEPK